MSKIDKKTLDDITRLVMEEIWNQSRKKNEDLEVVIGVSPTFGKEKKITLNGLNHKDIIFQIVEGIKSESVKARVIKIFKTADVGFIGKEAALMSNSGISIGIQSKGTVLIHRKDLYPLTNLELFPQAPLLTLEMYREIGKNAAKYAKNENPIPLKVKNDPMTRPKYQLKAALYHIVDTEKVDRDGKTIDFNMEA